MKRFLLLGVVVLAVLIGCVSGDNAFLIQKLSDEDKSQALAQAGIDAYQLYIVRNKDFAQMASIKEYFNAALRFDPSNERAQQYLDTIDNYKATQLKINISAAQKVLAKPKRTDDDLYLAVVYLRTSEELEPGNATVAKMLSDTQTDWSKLGDTYLQKAKALTGGVDDKTPAATREKAYTDAYAIANKALDLDPRDNAAKSSVNSIKAELTKMVAVRIDSIQKLIVAGKYADARTQVSGLNDLNRRAGNDFDADVRAQSYALNFTWAKTLYAQKDYATAEARVDAALAANRTGEAMTLKKTLSDLRAKAGAGASFDQALADIDRLIAAGDLLAAHRRLDAVANTTTDQSKLDQLDARDQKILDALKPLYDQGVQAYRDEDFKTAIDTLQIVVGVKVDYEQAADYLDKAKAKQKLLDKS
jgi:hypothetical protein